MKSLTKPKSAGTIKVIQERNQIELYWHQTEALHAIDKAIASNKSNGFAGILVIPTGGGKTLTAVQWVLKHIINNNKKVLWIAHRHELLEQAFEAVEKNSHSNLINKRKHFNYRIVSGQHCKPAEIREDDDFIIASKDSLNIGKQFLVNNWLNSNSDVFLVVDEAHHATAKTYRKIIDLLNKKVNKLDILGLTATPYRTKKEEKGLLKKVFHNDIVYKIDLKTLISRGILSEPIFKELRTGINMNIQLTGEDIKRILNFDSIPKDIAGFISQNKIRNKKIVQEYLNNKEEYGKLLVFAVNKVHAIMLNKLFRESGIVSDYVISPEKNMVDFGSVELSNEANRERIRKFKNNEIDVLINVNILTEGTDLPNVQTVFLTRPTASNILMTQMIGRALRGKKAGGTEKAYIVSFVDGWKNKLTWINPEKLFIGETAKWDDSSKGNATKLARIISIKKIEEFAKIADDSVDVIELMKMDFIKTIPLGIYSFSVTIPSEHNEETKKNCEILVYDHTQMAFEGFLNSLPLMLVYKPNEIEWLDTLADQVENYYFSGYELITSYNKEDIKDIIRYFELNGVNPPFFHFKDREKFDISIISKYIYEKELGGKRKKEYLDEIWGQEESFFKIYFGDNKLYFRKSIENELLKLEEPELYAS